MFFDNKRKQTLFRSYWVHTAVQFAVMVTFVFIRNSSEAKFALMLFLSSPLAVVLYVSFQFPITSFLIVLCDNITQRLSKNQDLIFKIVLSTGLFVILSSLLVFLVVSVIVTIYTKDISFFDTLRFLLTYITPIFLVGEVLRQRVVMKKVY